MTSEVNENLKFDRSELGPWIQFVQNFSPIYSAIFEQVAENCSKLLFSIFDPEDDLRGQWVDLFRLSPVAMPVGGDRPLLIFYPHLCLEFGNLRLQRHLDI